MDRREALARLAALTTLPLTRWNLATHDPLAGTIVGYQHGLRRGSFTSAEITARALERCRTTGKSLRAIDAINPEALASARASDARRRANQTRGPLDGVPVFAKAIYDVNGLP